MKHAALAAIVVLALACLALAGDAPLLVTPAWLAERLGRADVRVVDLSAAEDYAKGHIPGALHLDIGETRMQASEGVFRVPTPEEGRRLFARLGITPDTTVVLYDDEGGLHAAWLFLVLDVLGHPRVSVLDGGSQRWRAGGGATSPWWMRAPGTSSPGAICAHAAAVTSPARSTSSGSAISRRTGRSSPRPRCAGCTRRRAS